MAGVTEEVVRMETALEIDHDKDIDANDEEPADDCCGGCLRKLGCGGVARLRYTWPRSFKFMFAIVLPLFSLIALSVICGYGLAALEGPNELQNNDAVSARLAMTKHMKEVGKNISAHVPRVCHLLYLRNVSYPDVKAPVWDVLEGDEQEGTAREAIEVLTTFLETTFPYDLSLPSLDANATNATREVNHTDMHEKMLECGQDMSPIIELIDQVVLYYEGLAGDFTLNWNRCVKRTRRSQISLLANITAVRPAIQKANRQIEFDRNLEELYQVYLQGLLEKNISGQRARTLAYTYAAGNATGRPACETNVNAAAWFWFTIETTIGYGNQSVETKGGRAMVYTLGFICILVFAGILGQAGAVALTVVDVFMTENDLRVSKETKEKHGPIYECVFWGVVYYGWMLVLAAYTKAWKEERLGQPFSLADGFWFSYITSTTVGFGDIYLEPAVIVGNDIIVWPLLVLVGFVFLSAFLGTFAEILSRCIPGGMQQDTFRERCVAAPIIRKKKKNNEQQQQQEEEQQQVKNANKGRGEVQSAHPTQFDQQQQEDETEHA